MVRSAWAWRQSRERWRECLPSDQVQTESLTPDAVSGPRTHVGILRRLKESVGGVDSGRQFTLTREGRGCAVDDSPAIVSRVGWRERGV